MTTDELATYRERRQSVPAMSPPLTRPEMEAAAVEAHNTGRSWSEFWSTVRASVEAAEPWDMAARRRIVDRLLHLFVCGDGDGALPVGDDDVMPWELDDMATVASDDTTAARCLFPMEAR